MCGKRTFKGSHERATCAKPEAQIARTRKFDPSDTIPDSPCSFNWSFMFSSVTAPSIMICRPLPHTPTLVTHTHKCHCVAHFNANLMPPTCCGFEKESFCRLQQATCSHTQQSQHSGVVRRTFLWSSPSGSTHLPAPN